MKQLGVRVVLVILFGVAVPAWSQGGVVTTPGNGGGTGGCVNSPENPTALLALAGAGGAAVSYVRARRRVRRGK